MDVKLRDHAGSLPTDVLRLLTRQRGLVVALLGADGAGKSTAAECLHAALPFDVSIRYLGTKRRVRSADGVGSARPSRSRIRKLAGLARWIVTTVSELWRIELAARRGTIVVCDRHPLESGLLGDEMPLVRRMKRLVVRTVLPRPDVIVLLSASGELLHRRKGEHSPEYLDHMTAVWRDVVTEAGGVTVAADRSPAAVCDELQELIWGRLADRNAF